MKGNYGIYHTTNYCSHGNHQILQSKKIKENTYSTCEYGESFSKII